MRKNFKITCKNKENIFYLNNNKSKESIKKKEGYLEKYFPKKEEEEEKEKAFKEKKKFKNSNSISSPLNLKDYGIQEGRYEFRPQRQVLPYAVELKIISVGLKEILNQVTVPLSILDDQENNSQTEDRSDEENHYLNNSESEHSTVENQELNNFTLIIESNEEVKELNHLTGTPTNEYEDALDEETQVNNSEVENEKASNSAMGYVLGWMLYIFCFLYHFTGINKAFNLISFLYFFLFFSSTKSAPENRKDQSRFI